MNTGLNTLVLIPLTQPYSGPPWNYTDAVPAAIPAGAVDWVLIDLRQAASPDLATSGTSIAKKAVFLKSDGTIVDKDGSSTVKFYNVAITNNLYPVIYHRNHIAIMANNAVTRTDGIYTYDFSTALSQVYGGSLGYKQIPGTSPAVYGMVAGDIDHDGSVWVSDYNIWAANQGASGDYYNADLDFDGNIWVSDYNKWAANQGVSNPLMMANRHKFVTAVP
jgi:hypothetical protein